MVRGKQPQNRIVLNRKWWSIIVIIAVQIGRMGNLIFEKAAFGVFGDFAISEDALLSHHQLAWVLIPG